MGYPKLDNIVNKMKKGVKFELTRDQYIKTTGCDIPQNKNYTEKRSAVARAAMSYGYTVKVIPERLVFEKID